MKYSIEINLPLKRTFDLYTNRDSLKQWQKMIITHDLVSGESGEIKSVSKLSCKGVDIYETITSKTVPSEIVSEYEHKRNGSTKMFHTATNRFSKLDDDKTLLEMTIDQKVVGFLPRIIMSLAKGAVKKHHQKLIDDFKSFAEDN